MLRVGDLVPKFDSTAVVECEVLQLKWNQLHGNKNLVLLFNSIHDFLDQPNGLATLTNAVWRFETLQCTLVVICRDELFEILTHMRRLAAELGSKPIGFPVIVDTDNRIASMYDMLSGEGPHSGHVIASSIGKVRSIAVNSISVGLNVDEVIRCVASIVEEDV